MRCFGTAMSSSMSLLNLEADEAASLTELPAFKAFQEDIAERCVVPPQATRLAAQLVDFYGFCADRQ
jgi:hypothetical protein